MVARKCPNVTFRFIACLDSLPFNRVVLRLTPFCTYFFCTRDNPIYRVKPSTQILKYDADVFQLLNSHYQDFTLACLVAIQKQDDLEDAQEPEPETMERTTTASKYTERLGLND
jgi:hypothetical protein